jgi:hypothetical protein
MTRGIVEEELCVVTEDMTDFLENQVSVDMLVAWCGGCGCEKSLGPKGVICLQLYSLHVRD